MRDELLAILGKKPDFSGLIGLETGGQQIRVAEGFASREHHVKNGAHTRFATASVTKGFTAVAILRYLDRGQLELEDEIGMHLDLEGTLIDPSVTLLQLMDHTSGIADYFDEDIEGDYEALWREHPAYLMRETGDFFPLFAYRPPVSEPGVAFSYCNAGFILLGMVLERVSGMSFADVLRKEVFEPLEMGATDMDPLDHQGSNTATHYLPDGRSNIYALPILGGPDGGAYTTAEDLEKFWKGLMTTGFLKKATLERLLAHHVPVSGPFFYGMGFWRKIVDDRLFKIYLRGEDPGVSLMTGFYPKSETILSVFSNNESPAAQMTMAIEKALDIR
jgi:CubicO group peptidase (beta-lactamase class C family)